MKRLINSLIAILVCFFMQITFASCLSVWDNMWYKKNDSFLNTDSTMPSQKIVSYTRVHDPSVFYDEESGFYYAFGTHFAVSRSTDLISWEIVNKEGNPEGIFGTKNWRTVLNKSSDYVGDYGGIKSTWAPDVIKFGNRYYMYYALTAEFGKGKSVIGRVSSDAVTGPYSNEEVLVYSNDNWWHEPNAIDPQIFFDKKGKLWMVYGSYFSGIYIKELHRTGSKVGLAKTEGFGKLLWRDGYSSGVEGPYIFYNAETEYYYLMVSEGNLASNYNMRVARSKNPDGPYYDINNEDVATPRGKGNKIAGNYRYEGQLIGYAALGHNSVTKINGSYYVIYHRRSGIGTKINQNYYACVNTLLFNEDAWPVMAPNNYLGEVFGRVNESDIVGEYDLIIHTEQTIDDYVESDRYCLNANYTIVKNGIKVGSWELKEGLYLNIVIDDLEYKGCIIAQYVDYLKKNTYSITATSFQGRPLWANKL